MKNELKTNSPTGLAFSIATNRRMVHFKCLVAFLVSFLIKNWGFCGYFSSLLLSCTAFQWNRALCVRHFEYFGFVWASGFRWLTVHYSWTANQIIAFVSVESRRIHIEGIVRNSIQNHVCLGFPRIGVWGSKILHIERIWLSGSRMKCTASCRQNDQSPTHSLTVCSLFANKSGISIHIHSSNMLNRSYHSIRISSVNTRNGCDSTSLHSHLHPIPFVRYKSLPNRSMIFAFRQTIRAMSKNSCLLIQSDWNTVIKN